MWPHQFTPNGKEYQIGEDNGIPKFAKPMICVHCDKEFISGLQSRPPDPCPARTDKKELQRIKS
jgi:hypothetical protein